MITIRVPTDLVNALTKIVGPQYVTNEKFVLVSYTRDFGAEPARWPDVVVRPGSAEEISKILKLANKLKVPVVPRGGGTAQEGGCLPSRGGIVLETTRMNKILNINKDSATITVQAGTYFGKIESTLKIHGWKIGVIPSGALGGTIGGHVSKAGLGWGNIAYGCQGDQVIGLQVVLPKGEILNTGSGTSPSCGQIWRYTFGPDLTGLFIGAEGAFGVITEITLKIYPLPEATHFEKFTFVNLGYAVNAFREICHRRLAFYISAYQIYPTVKCDIFIEGSKEEVEYRKKAILEIIQKYQGESLGIAEVEKFWRKRFFESGKIYKGKAIPRPVVFYLPFSKIEEVTEIMYNIIKKHNVKMYAMKMFPMANIVEHANLVYCFDDDQEELHKIQLATKEMMKKALQLGGAPYTKGRQWGPFIAEHLKATTYWKMTKTIKKLLDPNDIMNTDVMGI